MARIGLGDLSGASAQLSSSLNNLDSSATSSLSNMIKSANTNWDTPRGSESTTSMKDALETWMGNVMTNLNSLKQAFDSAASSVCESEKASFSPAGPVEHSSAVQGGDIVNASDVNGSYDSDAVSQALTSGTTAVTSDFQSAIGAVSGMDFGLHADLQAIANQIVDTLNRYQSKISSALSDWNNTEVQHQDQSGEAYANFISSTVSSLNA